MFCRYELNLNSSTIDVNASSTGMVESHLTWTIVREFHSVWSVVTLLIVIE